VGFSVPVIPWYAIVRPAPGLVVIFAPDFVRGKAPISVVWISRIGIIRVLATFLLAQATVEPRGIVQRPIEIAVVSHVERMYGTCTGEYPPRFPMPDVPQIPRVRFTGPLLSHLDGVLDAFSNPILPGKELSLHLVEWKVVNPDVRFFREHNDTMTLRFRRCI
tara:strand:+ start:2651 stop:3139 length:489 start_codon:yes stop_codon:yes gene_type:complete